MPYTKKREYKKEDIRDKNNWNREFVTKWYVEHGDRVKKGLKSLETYKKLTGLSKFFILLVLATPLSFWFILFDYSMLIAFTVGLIPLILQVWIIQGLLTYITDLILAINYNESMEFIEKEEENAV